ncbi:MAG: hypothetical protein HUU57_14330 [Bdellovibrio sp.]|nr:hypothetical protein [Bdellovibrio sp.]
MRQQTKSIATIAAISLITLLGYQNCTNMKFAEMSSQEAANLGPAIAAPAGGADIPAEQQQSTPQVSDPYTPPTAVTVKKITCTATSEPAGKPTGFVYSASSNSCVPSAGYGPTYRFRILCDSDLPSNPVGIRIQYNVNYFSQITNVNFNLKNSANYYRGRSFYTRAYAPGGTPAAALATVYGLTQISKTSANSVVVQAPFFFLDGHPVDSVSRDCNNVRNWDLGLYIYIDKNGSPTHFNTEAARVNLL